MRTAAPACLSLQAVSKRFGDLAALDGVDLDVAEGEVVCLVGAPGCGKTSLLRIVAGLDRPDDGRVLLDGADLSCLPAWQRRIGVVFPSHSLFPNMTVGRNLAYGLECRGWTRAAVAERVAEMLALVKLEREAGCYQHELSAGQQWRAVLARALAPAPALLLLDASAAALEAMSRDAIRTAQCALGVTTIVTAGNRGEAVLAGSRIVSMQEGRVSASARATAARRGRRRPPDHASGTVERSVFLGAVTRVTLVVAGRRRTVDLRGKVMTHKPGDTLIFQLPDAAA